MWHGNNNKTWSMYETKNEQRRNKISLEVLIGLPLAPTSLTGSEPVLYTPPPVLIGIQSDTRNPRNSEYIPRNSDQTSHNAKFLALLSQIPSRFQVDSDKF